MTALTMNENIFPTSTVSVKYISGTMSEQWDNFVLNNSKANFYQLYEWKNINSYAFQHRTYNLAALEAGKIIGILPLVHLKSRLFGNILCSMPFVNYGGMSTTSAMADAMLLAEATNLTRNINADFMELRSISNISSSMPCSTHKVSMTIKLNNDPEVLWNAFSSKHRTNIRRAYKNGLEVISGGREYLDTFYNILAISWRNMGTPIYKKSYFERIFSSFGEMLKIFICTLNGKPVAGAFNGYFNGVVEGMWAGAIPEARKAQYSYVLYWEMIKDACKGGFETYHLGRSSVDSGGEQFKKKWNAEQVQLYWSYYLNNIREMPRITVDNPKYKLAIKTWRHLPVNFTTLIGPLLAKNIP